MFSEPEKLEIRAPCIYHTDASIAAWARAWGWASSTMFVFETMFVPNNEPPTWHTILSVNKKHPFMNVRTSHVTKRQLFHCKFIEQSCHSAWWMHIHVGYRQSASNKLDVSDTQWHLKKPTTHTFLLFNINLWLEHVAKNQVACSLLLILVAWHPIDPWSWLWNKWVTYLLSVLHIYTLHSIIQRIHKYQPSNINSRILVAITYWQQYEQTPLLALIHVEELCYAIDLSLH